MMDFLKDLQNNFVFHFEIYMLQLPAFVNLMTHNLNIFLLPHSWITALEIHDLIDTD